MKPALAPVRNVVPSRSAMAKPCSRWRESMRSRQFAIDGPPDNHQARLVLRHKCAVSRRSWPGLTHGCPVKIFWTQGMALIPLGSGRFADDPDTRRGTNAMRHQNSVFHELLKHLPWDEFDR